MMVTGNLEPSPGSIRHRAEYTLDRMPVHRRAQSRAYSHSYTMDTPIILPCRSLDWGRKPEYLEKTRRTCKNPHTYGSNPGPWSCEANVLTT
ncbi:hypothetical protein AMELA_G00122370, partial [Ameiurus melas]